MDPKDPKVRTVIFPEPVPLAKTIQFDGKEVLRALASSMAIDLSRTKVYIDVKETGDHDRGTYKRELASIRFVTEPEEKKG